VETAALLAFKIEACSSAARAGRLECSRGLVETPAFMAVGTQGSVKALTPELISRSGTSIVLGNTYHLMLRPGAERVRRLGGLHSFMAWEGPILTDSGGYQVFSLAERRRIDERGAHFRSHIDGSLQLLTPERSMEVQRDLGSDIAMAFDECAPWPCPRDEAAKAMARTHRWAERCLRHFAGPPQALFGIVQGAFESDLRVESAQALAAIPFDGYAVGGLSVGEPKPVMTSMLEACLPQLPVGKPRYLMGVGTPLDLMLAVERGIDMFDCVLPTRNARNGQAFTSTGKISIKQARFAEDGEALDAQCGCDCCRKFSRAYLHHLYRSGEILSAILLTLHNLTYYQNLMKTMRAAILADDWSTFRASLLQFYPYTEEEPSCSH